MGNISEFRKMRFGYGELACYLWVGFFVPAKVTSHLVDLWSTINTIYELVPDSWTRRRSHTHTQSPFKICLRDSLYPPDHIHQDTLGSSELSAIIYWKWLYLTHVERKDQMRWFHCVFFESMVFQCFYISLCVYVSPEAQITWQQQTIPTVEATKRARSKATSVSNLTVKKGSKRG